MKYLLILLVFVSFQVAGQDSINAYYPPPSPNPFIGSVKGDTPMECADTGTYKIVLATHWMYLEYPHDTTKVERTIIFYKTGNLLLKFTPDGLESFTLHFVSSMDGMEYYIGELKDHPERMFDIFIDPGLRGISFHDHGQAPFYKEMTYLYMGD